MSFIQESQIPNLEYSKSNEANDDGDEKETINDCFTTERVFLSNIDSYHGRYIAAAIGRKISRNEENDNDEIEEVEEKSSENANSVHHRLKYGIIGSVTDKDFLIPNNVEEIIGINETSKILEKILSCKFIIYDISEDANQVDEAARAIKALDEEFSKSLSNGSEMWKTDKPINYILISTVLTWAKTKPIDPNEPDAPITEDDYRRRKPHPNYKLHFDLEKEVIRIGKKHKKVLKTIVVASGLVYGLEENLMGTIFKLAWMNEPCPYLLPGNNTVPLLHVNDLASIICNLMESMPKKRWYIIATEETAPTFKEMVKAISKELGTGELTEITKEEDLPMKEMNMALYDHLTVDLNVSPKYILENMDLDHVPYDMNFLNIMKETVSNFIESHGLKAIKIFIHGPPLSGKTYLANKLCSYYQLHYLSYHTIIEDFCNRMNELKKKASKIKSREDKKNESENEEENVDEDKDDDELEEDDVLKEEYENELLEIFQQLEEANLNDTIPDQDVIIRVIKEKLLSKPCQNQGYVLDGYPETYDQAKNLFCINTDENEKEEEDEEEEDEEDEKEEEDDEAPLPFVVDKRIIPDYVFNLNADDAILLYRGKNIPPEREMDNQYNEESLKKSIFDFRVRNSDVSTVMNFFLEVDKYPIDISVNNDEKPFLEKSFKNILKFVGKPCNFEKEDGKISKEEEALLLLQKEELLQERLKELYEEKLDKRAKLEEWVIAMSVTKKEEEDSLKAKTLPIRDYILKEIFPFLKEALVEIYRIKPRDPVDYLAEYLFTHYVDGKCFPSESNEVTEDDIWACLGMANTSRVNKEYM